MTNISHYQYTVATVFIVGGKTGVSVCGGEEGGSSYVFTACPSG